MIKSWFGCGYMRVELTFFVSIFPLNTQNGFHQQRALTRLWEGCFLSSGHQAPGMTSFVYQLSLLEKCWVRNFGENRGGFFFCCNCSLTCGRVVRQHEVGTLFKGFVGT
jgi:hypothetical protein